MSDASVASPARAAGLVFTLGALGEIAVGVAILVFPEIGRYLVGAPLDASGLLLARMLGGAALALGITWWRVRTDAAAMARCAPGFIVYNVAIGALFGAAALAAAQPALPWLVCAAHLLLAAAFIGARFFFGSGTAT